jgi:hypothetical protein
LATFTVGFSYSITYLSFSLFISNSYYHQKDKFSQLLEVLSSEIATRAKQIITTDISSESDNVCLVI